MPTPKNRIASGNRSSADAQAQSEIAKKALAEAGQLRLDGKEASLRRAVEEYELAIRSLRATGEKEGEIAALIEKAEVLGLLGNHQEAIRDYARALGLLRATADYRRQCQAFNGIGVAYGRGGDSQRALDYYRQALELSQKISDRSAEARSLSNLGEAYYDRSEMKAALDYLTQALELWQTLGDSAGQAETLKYLGYLHTDLSELSAALDCYQRALPLRQANHDLRGEAETTTAIGLVYVLMGEREKAIERYAEAEKIFRATGDRRGLITALNGRGAIYAAVGSDRALDCHNEALQLSAETGDLQGQIVALRYLANVYRSLGNASQSLADNQAAQQSYTQAVERQQQALMLSRSLHDRRIEAYIQQDLADLYDSLGEKTEALSLYQKALVLSRATGDRRGQAASLDGLGRISTELNQQQRAFSYFDQALSLSRSAKDRGRESLTLFHLAKLERDRNELRDAQRNIEAAIQIIESLRTKVASQDYRDAYFAFTRQYYEVYVDVLVRLDKEAPNQGFSSAAFRVSEQARARSLLELIKEANLDVREGVDAGLLEQERKLEQALDAKAGRHAHLVAAKDNAGAAAVVQEINGLTTAYDEIKAQIKSKSPRYAALTQPQPLSVQEVQQQVLDDDSLLLEYMLGDQKSYLWAVTRADVSLFELPSRERIEDASRSLYKLLTANQPVASETFEQHQARLSEATSQIPAATAALSELVLGPVMNRLGTKRLLIVSDGALQYISFQALTTPSLTENGSAETAIRDSAERIPLLVDHEIINEPSASSLALVLSDAANRKAASKSVAVFANPVFEVDDPRVKPASSDPSLEASRHSAEQSQNAQVKEAFRDIGLGDALRIPPLPASREEAEAIMSLIPWRSGLKAVGFDASRATITGTDLGQYRIVHFATHGFVDYRHPELSGLVLSLVDDRGNPQDGFLRMHDIYNLKLPVDLVVLSACNTGLGKDVKGEGLIGLTRGFMYAGAGGVVASLWKVDDDATAELMKHFYEGMFAHGLSPAKALRDAQLTMWRQPRWHAPYFWAAFVLQGQYNQKEMARPGPTALQIGVIAAVIFALSVTAGLFLRRRRKRNL